jgi:lysophospholipase L1-like esterase
LNSTNLGRGNPLRRVSVPGRFWASALCAGALGMPLMGCGSSSDTSGITDDASSGSGGAAAAPDGSTDGSVSADATGTGGATAVLGTGGAPGSGGLSGTSTGGAAAPGSGGTAGGGGAGGRSASGGSTGTGGRAGGAGNAGNTRTGGAGGGGTSDITVWLAGDSTVANGNNPCPIGWGASFQSHLNTHATVSNNAVGGTTVRSWLYSVSSTMGPDGECVLNSPTYLPPWTRTLAGMKAGHYLLIQFGINDTSSGACPKHVSMPLFEMYFGMMAQAAKDRGANPIFLTAVSSIACSGNVAMGTRGGFAAATKAAGVRYDVPVIDLEQLSVGLYTSLGFCPLPGADTASTYESGAVGAFFCEDHTHFERAGAAQIATLVAKAIKDQGFGLASYLTP